MKAIAFIIYWMVFAGWLISCDSSDGSGHQKNSNDTLLGDDERFDLVKRLYDQEKNAEAIPHLNALINGNYNHIELHYMRGIARMALDSIDGATKDFNHAIADSYRVADSYYNLGICTFLKNRDSLSIIYFEKSHMLNPEDTDALERIRTVRFLMNEEKRLERLKNER